LDGRDLLVEPPMPADAIRLAGAEVGQAILSIAL
jgi:hypothetical protein